MKRIVECVITILNMCRRQSPTRDELAQDIAQVKDQVASLEEECVGLRDRISCMERVVSPPVTIKDPTIKLLSSEPCASNELSRKPHERLANLMNERGDAVTTLSARMSYSRPTLARFLNGRMSMTPALAEKLESAGYMTAAYWLQS